MLGMRLLGIGRINHNCISVVGGLAFFMARYERITQLIWFICTKKHNILPATAIGRKRHAIKTVSTGIQIRRWKQLDYQLWASIHKCWRARFLGIFAHKHASTPDGWIPTAPTRSKGKRSKYGQYRTQMQATGKSNGDSLRGGAQGSATTGRSRNERLLQGLSSLLATLGDEETDNEQDDLYNDLQELVAQRPSNLVLQLKKLIAKHDHTDTNFNRHYDHETNRTFPNNTHTTTWTDVVKKTGNKDKGKGTGSRNNRPQAIDPKPHKGAATGHNKGEGLTAPTWQPRPQDWKGEPQVINTLDQYCQQKQGTKLLFKPKSSHDLDDIYTEYQAKESLPMTIVLDKRDFQDNPFWDHTWEDKRIPVLQDSRTISRWVSITKLSDTAPDLKPPTEAKGRTTSTHATTTIRIHIEEPYTQHWDAILTNPGRYFRLWAQEDIGHYIQDTWGWQLVAFQSVLHSLKAGHAPKEDM